MLNKYPEIWLRESVMLVDLQTSSIFSPSPPLLSSFSFSPLSPFSSSPVSAHKRPTVQRRETGLRHSTQLLLISLHSEEKNALTYMHTGIGAHTAIRVCIAGTRARTHTHARAHTHTHIYLQKLAPENILQFLTASYGVGNLNQHVCKHIMGDMFNGQRGMFYHTEHTFVRKSQFYLCYCTENSWLCC